MFMLAKIRNSVSWKNASSIYIGKDLFKSVITIVLQINKNFTRFDSDELRMPGGEVGL